MAKTTVSTITADIKLIVDYNIVDSDLDSLILKSLNFVVKRMKQLFLNEQLYDEIGAHDTFSTTADQEFVDIASETVDLDQSIILTERTNDSPIQIVTFKEYRERFPDPTANKSTTPDIAAFFANRVYLGPTPSGIITLFLDYIKLLTKMTSNSTLPYEDKYDEVVITGVIWWLVRWLDRGNIQMAREARGDYKDAVHDYIVGAAKNIGMNQQSLSRREERPFFAPRKVIS